MITAHEEKIIKVTILILIDGFLQYLPKKTGLCKNAKVTILILIDGFLQYNAYVVIKTKIGVTILILIDGFLQSYTGLTRAERKNLSQSLF